MTEAELFQTRLALLRFFLADNGYDGILLSRPDNFAMATGGRRNYIYTASDVGACSLFVRRDGRAWCVGNNIEAPRMMEEELAGLDCASESFLWFETGAGRFARRSFSGQIVSDDGSVGPNVHEGLTYLRALLTPLELEKYRVLGRLAAQAMEATLSPIQPGMTEAEAGALLIAEGAKRGCQVPVCLIAADERITRHRHPLPTLKPLVSGSMCEKEICGYVMVVGCFLREGLVASITRFKRVGELPPGMEDAYARVCGVDALIQEASVPGKTLGDVFEVCQRAYPEMGFPQDEWHNHHQGGTTGYAGRTCKATPGVTFPILETSWSRRVKDLCGMDVEFGHAFAWNPSAKGVKSEDTFILRADGVQETVTATPGLPEVDLARVLGRETAVRKWGMGA